MRKKPIVCLETRSRKEADLPSSVGWMASSSCPKGGKGNGGGGSTCQNIRSGEMGGGRKDDDALLCQKFEKETERSGPGMFFSRRNGSFEKIRNNIGENTRR